MKTISAGILFGPWGGKYKLRPRVVVFRIIWVHWNRSVDEGCFPRNKSSLQSWVLPCYQPHLCIYFITNTLLSTCLVSLEFHLISFFGENDLCAFFPSRLHIYVQDFVPDTGSVSICIHNLLKKQINVFSCSARLPLLFPRGGQSGSAPPTLRDILIFFVHPR